MKIVKIVNHGKNGVYLYSAIVEIEGRLYWTESKFMNDKKEKFTFDFTSLKINKELNDWSINRYIKTK